MEPKEKENDMSPAVTPSPDQNSATVLAAPRADGPFSQEQEEQEDQRPIRKRKLPKPKTPKLDPAISKALRPMMRALRSDNPAERANAVHRLLEVAFPEVLDVVVDELRKDQRSRNAALREKATHVLTLLGPEAFEFFRRRSRVPGLIAQLKARDANLRKQAAEELGRHAQESERVVPALITALRDPDEEVRRAAAGALGRLGPVAEAALDGLIAELNAQGEDVNRQTVLPRMILGPKSSSRVGRGEPANKRKEEA